MRKSWSWCCVSLALAVLGSGTVPAVLAATIVEKTVDVTIRSDGTVLSRTSLRLRLESTQDVAEWANFPIYLDSNLALESVEAYSVTPDGERFKVRRKDQDTRQGSGGFITYSSGHAHVLEFSSLAVGSEIFIDYAVLENPYHPSDQIFLAEDDPIERLEVSVRGGGDAWRWRLDGPTDGFEIEEAAGGLRITANDLAAPDPPDYAPFSAVWPVLRFAWESEGSWREIGSWYSELLAPLPRDAGPVRAQARELIAGLDDSRERFEALVAFMRRKVRYVAVEIGVGGFQPSAPGEVLDRRWGDCKDKALLLIDFLREVGIESYPALIWSGHERRVDVEFPTPFQFNHAIVAVPSSAVPYGEGDPVSDGYFFVDPTQERGSSTWLNPADQDQHVLIVKNGTGELVRTPILEEHERRRLVVTLQVRPDGQAVGGAGLSLSGRVATYFIEQMASAPPERTEEDARGIFASLLPGVTLTGVGWNAGESGVPSADLSAAVRHQSFVEGSGSRLSFRLTPLGLLTKIDLLDERKIPLVLRPQTTESHFNITLPEGYCLPEEKTQRIDNAVGFFAQTIAVEPDKRRVQVERRLELRRRWIEPEEFPELKELALAEHRSSRRRIRLACD